MFSACPVLSRLQEGSTMTVHAESKLDLVHPLSSGCGPPPPPRISFRLNYFHKYLVSEYSHGRVGASVWEWGWGEVSQSSFQQSSCLHCRDRIAAPIRTDHTRPRQFLMREVYCRGRGPKGVMETKGERERRSSEGQEGSAFYLGCGKGGR